MTWKLSAVVSAAAFIATYLVSLPGTDVAVPAAPQTPAPASRPGPAVETEIEALANSLRVRSRPEADYRTPSRDPFRFQARSEQKPPAYVPPPSAAELPPPPPAPPLPVLKLSGVATDVVDGQMSRAAVISLPAGVLIVREGDSVAGLYTVIAIGEDSIELESTADQSRRTLRLGN